MIAPSDLQGVDEGLARRIIATARSIAPCLDTLTDEPRLDAIAILTGVANDAKSRGSRFVKGQRIGPASVDYGDSDTWFSADDRNALRALCGSVSTTGPVGQFPRASRTITDMWPECYDQQ